MTGQGDLLDLAAAHAAADKAVTRVGQHADPAWADSVLHHIWTIATSSPEMTTDDVWVLVADDTRTHEPRALGSLMRRAASEGWIYATDSYVPSQRAACHARPVRVWRSRIAA
jgi:hypothetical protein